MRNAIDSDTRAMVNGVAADAEAKIMQIIPAEQWTKDADDAFASLVNTEGNTMVTAAALTGAGALIINQLLGGPLDQISVEAAKAIGDAAANMPNPIPDMLSLTAFAATEAITKLGLPAAAVAIGAKKFLDRAEDKFAGVGGFTIKQGRQVGRAIRGGVREMAGIVLTRPNPNRI